MLSQSWFHVSVVHPRRHSRDELTPLRVIRVNHDLDRLSDRLLEWLETVLQSRLSAGCERKGMLITQWYDSSVDVVVTGETAKSPLYSSRHLTNSSHTLCKKHWVCQR